MTAVARHSARTGQGNRLVGVRPLLVVSMRQDARNFAPWIAIVTALSASSILAYRWIFTDTQDRRQLAGTLGANPALSLIFGPARDLLTADGFNAWRAGQLGALFCALMTILLVVRNSRANEDSGQAELIASGVIARGSRLAVALAMAVIASVALGVVCFLVTWACGGGFTATLLLSATFTAAGLMFAGVAAVSAQVGSDARTATAMGLGTLGICYVLRGYLDVSSAPEWTQWLTPLGWLEKVAPATDNNPWPLLPALALTAILFACAFALQARRDFGQGLVATKPGPARAGLAGNVWGFALKLQGPSLIAWLVAFVALGLLFGTLSTSMSKLLSTNPGMAAALGGSDPADLNFAFLVTILSLVEIIAAVMGVQLVLRMYDEEINFRVEPLLVASLRRSTYFASNLLLALTATAVAMIVAGTGMGLVAHVQDHQIATYDVIRQAVVTIPAVWVLVGLAAAAVGLAPSRRIIGWAGVVATFGLTLLGPTFKLPEWALSISPLHHIPNVVAAHADWSGLGWVAVVAAVFIATGFIGFQRRDVL